MTDIVKSAAKRSKQHTIYYVVQNGKKRRVPGTTTITGVMDKPALVAWANRIGLQGISQREYVDDLSAAGTCAHRMVELHCLGISDPTKHEDMDMFTKDQINHAMTGYIKFLDWSEEVGFEPMYNELELVHPQALYGGCLDIIGKLKKRNKIAIIDLKTCKGVFGEHKTQVAGGYSILADRGVKNGTNEANPIKYDEVRILRIGRCEDEGFEDILITPSEIQKHRRRFCICRALYEINACIDSKNTSREWLLPNDWTKYVTF